MRRVQRFHFHHDEISHCLELEYGFGQYALWIQIYTGIVTQLFSHCSIDCEVDSHTSWSFVSGHHRTAAASVFSRHAWERVWR